MSLSQAQIQQFKIDGYLVLPSFLSTEHSEELRALTEQHLRFREPPFELESEVQYPGAPDNRQAKGGETIRRLLMADRRAPEFLDLAVSPRLIQAVQQILHAERVLLNPNHHNCVMTKQPKFSSDTLWHRDTRYWSFNNKYLLNAWFALGDELAENGAMKILPGSHRWQVNDAALDQKQFLLSEHPDNQARLATARIVELNQGDLLLFSAHCFHAAGRNRTDQTKFSAVFTYHSETTYALPDTRSAVHSPRTVEL